MSKKISILMLAFSLAGVSVAANAWTSNSSGWAQSVAQHYTRVQPNASRSLSAPTTTDNDVHFSIGKPIGMGAHSRLQLNGFLTVGGSTATLKNDSLYRIPGYGAIGKHFNFAANSLLGLQLTAHLTTKISVVGQFVVNGDNTDGNKAFSVNAGWAFLRVEPRSGLQFQAGRFRLPLFLYSNMQQVGYNYPWMYLPNEVYRLVPFSNMNGINSIYRYMIGSTGWSLSLQPFYGEDNSAYDLYNPKSGDLLTTASFAEDNIWGAGATLSNSMITLHGSYAKLQLTTAPLSLPNPASSATNISVPVPTLNPWFYSVGARINWQHFTFAGEYAHRQVKAPFAALSGYYVMLGYHAGQLMPSFTYAHISTDNAVDLAAASKKGFAEPDQNQTSYTGALAYYVNSNIVSKASVSYIFPKQGNGLFTGPVNGRDSILYGFAVSAIF